MAVWKLEGKASSAVCSYFKTSSSAYSCDVKRFSSLSHLLIWFFGAPVMNTQMRIDPFITLHLNGLHDRTSDAPPYHARRQDDRRSAWQRSVRGERSVWHKPLSTTSFIKSLFKEDSDSSRYLTGVSPPNRQAWSYSSSSSIFFFFLQATTFHRNFTIYNLCLACAVRQFFMDWCPLASLHSSRISRSFFFLFFGHIQLSYVVLTNP